MQTRSGTHWGSCVGVDMHAGCPICRRALPQAVLSCAMVSESGCRVQRGHGGGKQGGAAPSVPCAPSSRRLAWPATRLQRCTGVAVIATGGVGGKAREIGQNVIANVPQAEVQSSLCPSQQKSLGCMQRMMDARRAGRLCQSQSAAAGRPAAALAGAQPPPPPPPPGGFAAAQLHNCHPPL